MTSTTLVELLRERAALSPERVAYVFLRDGEIEHARLTYGELDRRAQIVAAELRRLRTRTERALLVYPTGPDFVVAFMGCMYAGVIAVPVPSPAPGRLARAAPRLQAIARDAQARLVLTTSRLRAHAPAIASVAPDLDALRWVTTDTLDETEGGGAAGPRIESDAVAFLQYTSGSTAAPKGVIVSHANVLANTALVQRRFETDAATVSVSWLPLFHDMGLVGSLLGTLFLGSRLVLMSPEAFLQRPVRWLDAISRYGADTSGGPNFAYDLCVNRVTPEQRDTLDLSRWSLAFNGAERVRADTLQRFAETFASSGFRREAFYPCYGLAESTLLVSGGRRSDAPLVKAVESAALERGTAVDARDATRPETIRQVVSCGVPADDAHIAIVDPETGGECRAGRIGEIWVSGPSVARGYWERAEETNLAFGARLDGVPHPFLRTGDLGFRDDDGLFVTGRLKELIIIDGRNHYPQDIEQTAESADPAFRMGACAAFGIETDGRERLVIIAEVQRGALEQHDSDRAETAVRAICRAVADVHGVEAHAVQLVRPGSVPRTSSGKVRRAACRDAFLAGTLDVLEGQADVRPV